MLIIKYLMYTELIFEEQNNQSTHCFSREDFYSRIKEITTSSNSDSGMNIPLLLLKSLFSTGLISNGEFYFSEFH